MQRPFRLVADYVLISHQSVKLLGASSAASPAQARSPLLAPRAALRKLGLFWRLGSRQPSGVFRNGSESEMPFQPFPICVVGDHFVFCGAEQGIGTLRD